MVIITFISVHIIMSLFAGLVNTKNVMCYAPRRGGRPEGFSVETVKHPDGVMVNNHICLYLSL